MRLLLDEHFSPMVAQQLRLRGHDVLALVDVAALRQLPDGEVLRWAANEGRAVVTENVGDFLRLHADYLTRGRSHWGLILTTRRSFPRNAASLGRLILALDALLRTLESADALRSGLHWL